VVVSRSESRSVGSSVDSWAGNGLSVSWSGDSVGDWGSDSDWGSDGQTGSWGTVDESSGLGNWSNSLDNWGWGGIDGGLSVGYWSGNGDLWGSIGTDGLGDTGSGHGVSGGWDGSDSWSGISGVSVVSVGDSWGQNSGLGDGDEGKDCNESVHDDFWILEVRSTKEGIDIS